MEENVGFKLPEINIKGKYTIQVFDLDGTLVQETKKDNCINKILFSGAYSDVILKGVINNSVSPSFLALAKWIYLTYSDSAVENDYKNPILMGETIGYSHSDDPTMYAYQKRGIVNKSETKIINNYVEGGNKIESILKHLVIDFPTDRGNGTFNNIYLKNGASVNTDDLNDYNIDNYRTTYFTDTQLLINSKSANLSTSHGDGGSISHDDEHVYIQSLSLSTNGSTGLKFCYDTVAKIKQSNWNIEYITLQVPSDRLNKEAYIIQGGGFFWRIEQDYMCTRYKLDGTYKDLVNLAYHFSTSKVNIQSIKDIKNITSICHFTGDASNIYIAYRDSNWNCYLVAFDNNINKLLESVIEVNNNTIPSLSICYINNCMYVYTSTGEMFKIENSTEIKKSDYFSLPCSPASFYSKDGYLYYFSPSQIPGYIYYTHGKLKIATIMPWTSHVKLDTPITKTSANTMKIQYDITCEYVPVGGIENIE